MRHRIWTIRILISLGLSLLSLIIAFFLKDSLFLNYINTSFMIGLFFLVISGISYVIISGFFDVFVIGWKNLFFKKDPYVDKNHWSYDNNVSTVDDEIKKLRKKAKLELFIYLPLFIGFFLISQSFILLFLF
ncbi:hypothetical protein BHF71_06500 [Vulcanibacillus modesticaldus]|uniref:DUF3899 domain-containing protein n=1 Tax=Vulcanibacillus modesticaldus TaxID=337097 RepID=A0A1D2YWK0_9BACI|nr:DUF3899 domain-containing protein [Vulcanibacillus modesticaldus]OEG00090.1 hypothetical protein BHF71_06500 [Vulcanibacillus modesticaldus]